MYMELYSSFLYSKPLKPYFGVIQISLFERKAANLSIKELHVSLVPLTLKAEERFELKVYKPEIGAWIASAAPLYGINSHKKVRHLTLYLICDFGFWMHVNFSVKFSFFLEKNEGRLENELSGKIVCMALAFTATIF